MQGHLWTIEEASESDVVEDEEEEEGEVYDCLRQMIESEEESEQDAELARIIHEPISGTEETKSLSCAAKPYGSRLPHGKTGSERVFNLGDIRRYAPRCKEDHYASEKDRQRRAVFKLRDAMLHWLNDKGPYSSSLDYIYNPEYWQTREGEQATDDDWRFIQHLDAHRHARPSSPQLPRQLSRSHSRTPTHHPKFAFPTRKNPTPLE